MKTHYAVDCAQLGGISVVSDSVSPMLKIASVEVMSVHLAIKTMVIRHRVPFIAETGQETHIIQM